MVGLSFALWKAWESDRDAESDEFHGGPGLGSIRVAYAGCEVLILYLCTFTCMKRLRMRAAHLLRYGRRKAVWSLRSGDPQLYDLGHMNANRYESR